MENYTDIKRNQNHPWEMRLTLHFEIIFQGPPGGVQQSVLRECAAGKQKLGKGNW